MPLVEEASKSAKIKLKLINTSDLILKSLKISDSLPKKVDAEVIGLNTFSISELCPKKEIVMEYELSSQLPQKIPFKHGALTYEDEFGNQYAQGIPTTTLHFK